MQLLEGSFCWLLLIALHAMQLKWEADSASSECGVLSRPRKVFMWHLRSAGSASEPLSRHAQDSKHHTSGQIMPPFSPRDRLRMYASDCL